MPFFNSATPFDADVEKVTHEMNTVEDWSLILDICEKVSRQPNGAKDCLKSIIKRLNHKVPWVSMQALTLLSACVNNCGRVFHLEICSRDFVSECRTLISQKAHPKVAQKLSLLIKQWSEMKEFTDDAALNLIPSFYESLKKEGHDFVDTDSKPAKSAASASNVKKEEDDIMKAIALSLQEDSKTNQKSSSGGAGGGASLYPSDFNPQTYAKQQVQKEIRKVRSLYDFEAAEDNELTFKAGELICVLDDSDPNWWKGSNHRGEGLFPANFVSSDLSVEPEVKAEKKSVQFSEEVQVKTLSPTATAQEQEVIDEGKIDEVLALIQNADPTGETQPDSQQMLVLEDQCKAMGPLIDTELEKVDRKHANLVELNKKVMDALQMYHSLMKETPTYGYAAMKTNTNPAMYPPQQMAGAMGQAPNSMGQSAMTMAASNMGAGLPVSQPVYNQYMVQPPAVTPGTTTTVSPSHTQYNSNTPASLAQSFTSQQVGSSMPAPGYSLPPQGQMQAAMHMGGMQTSLPAPQYQQSAFNQSQPSGAAMFQQPQQQPLL